MKFDTFGERLKYVIEESNQTQKAFAEKLRLTDNYMSMLIKGKRVPSDKVVDDICEKLQVNKEWLLEGTGEIHAPSDQVTEITELLDKLITWGPSDIRTKFIKQLANLPLEHWHFIEEFADNILALREKEADDE